MAARRIGILGGTFDPIHCGHVDAARAAEAALSLTRVFMMPSNVPPHRTAPCASMYHRFAMTSLAVAGHPHWRASDLELRHESHSYTAATLRQLHAQGYAAAELFFIVGADAFADIASWKEYPTLLDFAHFAVVSRPGHAAADIPRRLSVLADRMTRAPLAADAGSAAIILIDARTADVSSTAIRERRARGETIAGLVPDAVRQHIEQHGLYASPACGEHEAATD